MKTLKNSSATHGGKRRWPVWAAALAVASLGAGYLAFPIAFGSKVAVVAVARGEAVRTVVASGRVQTPYRVEIGSQITGTVVAIPVAEGQVVRRDQLLIQLDDTEARSAVDQAEAAVAQAQMRLELIAEVTLPVAEEALAQAQANRVNAQQQFERVDKLRANGHATQAQWEDARKGLDVALAQERAARLQVASNREGGSDYRLGETALRLARASLTAARTRLAYTTIDAPADGTLIARNVERGNVVQPGKALMVLSPAGETQLVVQVDEKNLGLIARGQPALVSADAYPDGRFGAELVYINPAVDPQRASVEVKLRVPAPPGYLRQDMTVSVDIEVGRKPAALVLPATAVRDLASGSPWVVKVAAGRARRQPVKIGLRGEGRVEIIDGLAEGDLVVPAGIAVAEGRRVRPAPS